MPHNTFGSLQSSRHSYLRDVLIRETPSLREELEAVAVSWKMTGGHHNRTVVQVALSDARLPSNSGGKCKGKSKSKSK